MTKFTFEDKLNAVSRYLNGAESYQTIGDSIGAGTLTIRKWVNLYQYHGVEALVKSYTVHTVEFKLNVLNYMNEYGTSPVKTAAIFNIPSPSTVARWKKEMDTGGIDALQPKKKGRPSMSKDNQKQTKKHVPAEGSVEALQAEVERLRMENAYLKKLNALVQNKEKSPNKTKHK